MLIALCSQENCKFLSFQSRPDKITKSNKVTIITCERICFSATTAVNKPSLFTDLRVFAEQTSCLIRKAKLQNNIFTNSPNTCINLHFSRGFLMILYSVTTLNRNPVLLKKCKFPFTLCLAYYFKVCLQNVFLEAGGTKRYPKHVLLSTRGISVSN